MNECEKRQYHTTMARRHLAVTTQPHRDLRRRYRRHAAAAAEEARAAREPPRLRGAYPDA